MTAIAQTGRMALVGATMWATATLGQSTRPAATLPDSDTDLKQCMEYCRSTFVSIEQTLHLIDQMQQGRDSSASREKLLAVRGQLIEMRGQMSRCMAKLEHLRAGASSEAEPAPVISRIWGCPMHPQVRQDRPGNCPICDATLKPVPSVTTQPAVAEKPGEDGLAPAYESTAGR